MTAARRDVERQSAPRRRHIQRPRQPYAGAPDQEWERQWPRPMLSAAGLRKTMLPARCAVTDPSKRHVTGVKSEYVQTNTVPARLSSASAGSKSFINRKHRQAVDVVDEKCNPGQRYNPPRRDRLCGRKSEDWHPRPGNAGLRTFDFPRDYVQRDAFFRARRKMHHQDNTVAMRPQFERSLAMIVEVVQTAEKLAFRHLIA